MFKIQRAVAVIAGAAFFIGACKSAVEKQFEAEQAAIGPRLNHDPTDRAPLSQWWANEKVLLRLEENSAYSLYAGTNRYLPPMEHGRWSQQSYAALWLEPYNTIKVDPRRVRISKVGDKLALTLPGSVEPLMALDRPPLVLEDRIIGSWEGGLGSLALSNDLRYSLTPKPGAGSAQLPQLTSMRKGNWKIAENQLVLLSDIPGIEPLRLPLTATNKTVTIAIPGGTMNMVDPAAKASDGTDQPK